MDTLQIPTTSGKQESYIYIEKKSTKNAMHKKKPTNAKKLLYKCVTHLYCRTYFVAFWANYQQSLIHLLSAAHRH